MTDAAAPLTETPSTGSVPVPDPTALTAVAVNAAKSDLRRELTGVETLLGERILRVETILHDLDSRLQNEIANSVNSLEALQSARFAGLTNVVALLKDTVDSLPEIREKIIVRVQADIDTAVTNLQHLHEERFNAIQQQFTERDTRGEQDKKSSKEALDAALLAQKESVSQQNDANTTAATKTETNFTKQIDLVGTQITALDKSLTDRISELKERIDRGEGQGQGVVSVTGSPYEAAGLQQAERIAATASQRAVLSQVIAAIAVLASVVSIIIVAVHK
jgi:hypothetical protein